ncbi:MAG: PIN domain-containing protein [Candidatus Bathyarchaeaceae archaeon]
MSLKKLRAYLDSNVFIFGKERQESNSHIILDLAEEGKIVPVISYLTLEELREYFSRKYYRETAVNEIYYLISLPNLEIVSRDKVKQKIGEYKGVVVDKDLPHLISAILANVDYFVTYNIHFIDSRAKEYVQVVTQADFVKLLGIKPQPTSY